MNKDELIRRVAQCEESVSQRQARIVLERAAKIVAETLEQGDTIAWNGFGSFVCKEVPPKCIYSLQKKCRIMTEKKRVIAFKQSKTWIIE